MKINDFIVCVLSKNDSSLLKLFCSSFVNVYHLSAPPDKCIFLLPFVFFLFSTNFVAVARTQCLVAMFGFSSEFLTSERQVDLFVTTFYMRVSLSLGWMKLSSPKLSWFFHNYVRPWLRHNALNAKYIELALQCLAMSKFVLEKIGPKKLPQQNILIVRLPQQGQPMHDFFFIKLPKVI